MHTGTEVALRRPQGRWEGHASTNTHDALAGEEPGQGRSHCEELVLERNKRGAGKRAMEQHPQHHTALAPPSRQGVLPPPAAKEHV